MIAAPEVYVSLGAFPARHYREALRLAREASEPLLGPLSVRHVQICPQNIGDINVEDAKALRADNPDVRFRLHANARVKGWSSRADASSFGAFEGYFYELYDVMAALDAPAYTWHAGLRRNADFNQVLWRTRALEDSLGIPVGIEGLYPTDDDRYLLSTWEEYEMLLHSRVKYALDMSHLQILAHRHGRKDREWIVKALLQSDACIEIHLSGNDGDGDCHGQLATEPWWWDLFRKYANPTATVFTEGNQVRVTLF